MKSIWIGTIVYFAYLSLISAENTQLATLERKILYSHLQNVDEVKQFYEKLIPAASATCYPSMDLLFKSINITKSESHENLTDEELDRLVPLFVHLKLNEQCETEPHGQKWKNFWVGFISIIIINLMSLFGAIILPFRNKATFKWILIIFVGLAVGTLLGTGIFHLIPMAFSVENYDHDLLFLNKGLITIIVIYLFYMRDQLAKVFFQIQTISSSHCHVDVHDDEEAITVEQAKSKKSLRENLRSMKPIGWMILVSDLLHGFIDGLTIGAISTISISECLRMMVPIASEEFSHKLGDTAVLLSSGLPIKQALLMNFLSSCGAYPGFFIGAKLGQMENFHPWICALAGGMFVYIGLTDMIPELISMGNEIEKDYQQNQRPVNRMLKLKIIFSQNVGVVVGIAIMFGLGKYGDLLSNYVPF